MKNIAVVSLTNEYERRQHIDALFSEYELDFSYFDAINKLQVSDTLKNYNLVVSTERMSAGEIGCFLSHYCLWRKVVEQNMPYLMVFEDDIHFSKTAKTILSQLDWLPNNFDVIKLETTYEEVMLKKGFKLTSSHLLCQMKSRHLGSGGYIISYKGAKKLINKIQKLGIEFPIDHLVFESFINENNNNIYQVFPAICIQDIIYNTESLKFGSGLEKERKPQPVSKTRLSTGQKINREAMRFWRQLQITERYRTLLLILKGYRNQKIDYQE